MSQETVPKSIEIQVTDVGGITETQIELGRGISALVGENATNRTSLLRAVMSAFGSNTGTLRRGATEGQVTISLDGETYTRTVSVSGGKDRWSGDAVLTSSEDVRTAELFAFLLEDNEIRRSVERGENLYDLLMQPVDRKELERRETELVKQRDSIREDLEIIENTRQELVELESEAQSIEGDISELEGKQERLQEEVEELEAEVTPVSNESSEVEELEAELSSTENVLRSKRRKLHSAENKLEQHHDKLAALNVPDVDIEDLRAELDDVTDRLQTLRREKSSISADVDKVESVLEIHHNLRNGDYSGGEFLSSIGLAPDEVPQGPLSQSVDNQGVQSIDSALNSNSSSETTQCSACGSVVKNDDLKDLTAQLNSVKSELKNRESELEGEIKEVSKEQDQLSSTISDYEAKSSQKEELEAEIGATESRVESIRDEVDAAKQQVNEIESDLEEAEEELADQGNEQVAELTDRKSELRTTKSTLTDKQDRLERVRSDIEDAEDRINSEPELKEREQELQNELAEVRDKIDTLERQLETEFNETAETVLSLLEYENIARIRLVRGDEEFQLNVVREDSGSAEADRVSNLSESERVVAGIVTALTGYIVHDVSDICPVMVMDSIEMIDTNRTSRLLDYFADRTEFLIAALLPAHAEGLSTESENVSIVEYPR